MRHGLHIFDPRIAELGIEYYPERCWFCGNQATIPMKFAGESPLLYNACQKCAAIILNDPAVPKIYLVCHDHGEPQNDLER